MNFINSERDKTTISMHSGHRERLRNRLLCEHLETPPHEMLEFILQQPIKRRDTNKIAHELLNKFGSFANVCDADVNELMQIDGISEATATFLHLLPRMFKEYKMSKLDKKPILTCAKDIKNFIGQAISRLPNEEFYVICLNKFDRLMCYKNINQGDDGKVSFKIKDISNYAKQSNASGVILLHNHPNGPVEPSKEDIESTRIVFYNLAFLGIDLKEHVIINHEEDYYSFKDNNYIKDFKENAKNFLKTESMDYLVFEEDLTKKD